MAATASETRTNDAWEMVPPSESITLLSKTPQSRESYTSSRISSEPEASAKTRQADTSAKDALFAQGASRPFSPLSTPPKPQLPPVASRAGGGGRGIGGASTPNAGKGGGGPTGGGGGGPGLINANTFMGDNLGGVSPNSSHGQGAVGPASQPDQGAVSSLPTDFQTTYSMTAPTQASLPYLATPAAAHGKDNGHGSGNGHDRGNGHGHGHSSSGDPLYVLDMNSGETIPSNVTLNTFSTWSENLLAQVSGGALSSVTWDTSQAPDLTNISGTNTLNLQGAWSSFTGPAHTDIISVTETPQSGMPITLTMTFAVAGTDSPAYSSTRPTSSSTWPTVITPDQLQSGQPTQAAGPYASIGEADGSVQTSFAMPAYNPNTTPVSLDYNSTTANPQPIFLTEYQLPMGQAVPSTITAQLTFNGTALSTVTYSTSGLNAGDIMQIALQADANGLSTGRYPWSIVVSNGSNQTTYSGNVDIVNQSSSVFGAGWSLDNVEQLVSVTGGMMLVNPDGTSLFFSGSGGTYTSPAGDFSTLVKNQDGSYTRTLTDGTQINFNGSGQETSSVDTNGNTTSFSYTNGLLTSITDMNGQVTTLAYTNGLLTSITDPASRSATLSYSGSQLTSITDAGGNVWDYGYDSANDLTALTDPNNHTTTFTYNFADRVSSVTQPDGTTESLTAEQMNGLATPGTGTSTNPAASVLLATGDQAQFTDANNNVWTTGLDWLGFGVDTQDIDPLGDTSLNYINNNGLVWMSSDALSRPTVDFYDGKGNVTEEVAPDNTTQQYQYNSLSEVTKYTDQEGDITSYTYDSKGNLTQVTDALNDITKYSYNNAGLVTSTTDPNGNTTTYVYNSLNELTSTTNPLGGVTNYSYDNAGNQTSVADPLGNVTTYSYNALDWMTGQTLPDTPGVTSTYTYTYDKVGNQLSVTDPLDHTTSYAYNVVNEQTSETNALNQTTTFGYDNVGNQTSVTDPLGHATTSGYNAANEQTSMTDPMGNTTTYKYDAAGEQISVTDPMGNVTAYTYTPRGEVASKSVTNASGKLIAMTLYNHAPCGCLLSAGVVNVDGFTPGAIMGNITNLTSSGSYSGSLGGGLSGSFSITLSGSFWDGSGNVIASISGTLSGTLSGSIDNNGNVSGSVSASGSFTITGLLSGTGQVSVSGALSGTTSSNNGNVSGSISGPLGVSLMGSLNDAGALSGGVAPPGASVRVSLSNGGSAILPVACSFSGVAGQQTTNQRNALHQVTSVTDANGNSKEIAYDKNGNVTSVTDANGNTTAYAYNAMNAVTSVTNPLNQTTSYGYDKKGDLTSVTDPLGNDPTYTYDAQGRVLTATNNDGGVTKYSYDLAGNETSITDPDGNVTKYSYDAANELLSTTNPNGYQSTNVYNAGGLLTATTDADGRTIDYGYNADGQETSQTWVNGNYTAAYGYNADGELSSASDPFSTYTYTYDALGDETSVSNAGTSGVPTVTLDYGYDNNGNRTSLSDSLGGSISYSYDGDNQLTGLGLSVYGMTDAQVTMGYDAAGNLSGLTRTAPSVMGDTITTSYSYDKANELTNITDVDTTKTMTLASYSYGYNANGDVSSYQDNSGNSLTYGYDAADQLTSATGSLAGSNYTFLYNYDPNGNRTSTSTDINGSLTSATYSTGTGNELTSDGTYDYTYDNNGNTLTQTDIATGSVTYYTWDYENRLTEVKQEDSHGNVLNDENFTYDVLGNRIGVSLNGTQQLYTVYDGSNPYMDFNGSGNLTERYLTNPNALSQFYGQVDASGTPEWFLTDNINSIRQVINTTGTSLDVITYDPYGNVVNQTNSANAPRLGFASGAVDSLTGNLQFDARPYGPMIGRFLTTDPLLFVAGDTDIYRYVFNSPIERTDPSGEVVLVIVFVGIGIWGIGMGGLGYAHYKYKQAEKEAAKPINQSNQARINQLIREGDFCRKGGEILGWTGIGVVGIGAFGGGFSIFSRWAIARIRSTMLARIARLVTQAFQASRTAQEAAEAGDAAAAAAAATRYEELLELIQELIRNLPPGTRPGL